MCRVRDHALSIITPIPSSNLMFVHIRYNVLRRVWSLSNFEAFIYLWSWRYKPIKRRNKLSRLTAAGTEALLGCLTMLISQISGTVFAPVIVVILVIWFSFTYTSMEMWYWHLLPAGTMQNEKITNNYRSGLHENFIRDVSLDKEIPRYMLEVVRMTEVCGLRDVVFFRLMRRFPSTPLKMQLSAYLNKMRMTSSCRYRTTLIHRSATVGRYRCVALCRYRGTTVAINSQWCVGRMTVQLLYMVQWMWRPGGKILKSTSFWLIKIVGECGR